MNKLRAGIFAGLLVLAGPAWGQSGVGLLPPGNVVGNPLGTTAPPTAFPIFSTANTWTAAQTLTNLLSLTNSAPLGTIDLQTTVPVNGFYASGSAAVFQNCPVVGCLSGDHQHSSVYIKSTARLDATIAEYMVTIDSNLNSGLSPPWATSTTYAQNAFVVANGNVYKATTGGTSSNSGAGPSGTGTGITDGTVVWAYQVSGFAAAKVGFFNAATTGANASYNSWAFANDLIIGAGDTGLFKVGAEFDIQNNSSDCAVGTKNCYNVYISGNVGTNPVTAFLGLASTGSTTNAHYGMLLNGAFVANLADIEDSAAGSIGISIGGLIPRPHSVASIADASTSPIGLKLGGTYTTAISVPGSATYALSMTAGQNLCFSGTTFCMTAFNGAIFTTSSLTASFLQATTVQVIGSLPSCAAGTVGVRSAVSNGVASPALGSAVSTTGAVWQPVVCNGSAWVYG